MPRAARAASAHSQAVKSGNTPGGFMEGRGGLKAGGRGWGMERRGDECECEYEGAGGCDRRSSLSGSLGKSVG